MSSKCMRSKIPALFLLFFVVFPTLGRSQVGPKKGFSIYGGYALNSATGIDSGDFLYRSEGTSVGGDFSIFAGQKTSWHFLFMSSAENYKSDRFSDGPIEIGGHGFLGLQFRAWKNNFFGGFHTGWYREKIHLTKREEDVTNPYEEPNGFGAVIGYVRPFGVFQDFFVALQVDRANLKFPQIEEKGVELVGARIHLGYRW